MVAGKAEYVTSGLGPGTKSRCALDEGAAVWRCFEKVTGSEPSLRAVTGGSVMLFKMFHLIRCISGFTLYNVTYDVTW
jgi:hypothetical protein